MKENRQNLFQWLKKGYFIDFDPQQTKKYIQCQILQIQQYHFRLQNIPQRTNTYYQLKDQQKIQLYRTNTHHHQHPPNNTKYKDFYNFNNDLNNIYNTLHTMYNSINIQQQFNQVQIVQFIKGQQYYLMKYLLLHQDIDDNQINMLIKYIQLFLQFFIKFFNYLDLVSLTASQLYTSPHAALMLSYPQMLASLSSLLTNKTPTPNIFAKINNILLQSYQWLQNDLIPNILKKDLNLLNFQIVYQLSQLLLQMVKYNHINNIQCLNKLLQQIKYYISITTTDNISQLQSKITNLLIPYQQSPNLQIKIKIKQVKISLLIKFQQYSITDLKYQQNLKYILDCYQYHQLQSIVKIYLEHQNGLSIYFKKFYIKSPFAKNYGTYSVDLLKLFSVAGQYAVKLAIYYNKIQFIKNIYQLQQPPSKTQHMMNYNTNYNTKQTQPNHLKLTKIVLQSYQQNFNSQLPKGIQIHKIIPNEYKQKTQKTISQFDNQKRKLEFNSVNNSVKQQIIEQKKKQQLHCIQKAKQQIIDDNETIKLKNQQQIQFTQILQLLQIHQNKIKQLCASLFDGSKTMVFQYVEQNIIKKYINSIKNIYKQTLTTWLKSPFNLFVQTFQITLCLKQYAPQSTIQQLIDIYNQLSNTSHLEDTQYKHRKKNILYILQLLIQKNETQVLKLLFNQLQKIKHLSQFDKNKRQQDFINQKLSHLKFKKQDIQIKLQIYKSLLYKIKLSKFQDIQLFLKLFKIINEQSKNFIFNQRSYQLQLRQIIQQPIGFQYCINIFSEFYHHLAIINLMCSFFNNIQHKIQNQQLKFSLIQSLICKLLNILSQLIDQQKPTHEPVIKKLSQFLFSFFNQHPTKNIPYKQSSTIYHSRNQFTSHQQKNSLQIKNYLKQIFLNNIYLVFCCLPWTINIWKKLQIQPKTWRNNVHLKNLTSKFIFTNQQQYNIQFVTKSIKQSTKKYLLLSSLVSDPSLPNYKLPWLPKTFLPIQNQKSLQNNLLITQIISKQNHQLSSSDAQQMLSMLSIDYTKLKMSISQHQHLKLFQKIMTCILNKASSFSFFSSFINNIFQFTLQNKSQIVNYFVILSFLQYLQCQKSPSTEILFTLDPSKLIYLIRLFQQYFINIIPSYLLDLKKKSNLQIQQKIYLSYQSYLLYFKNCLETAIKIILSYKNLQLQLKNHFIKIHSIFIFIVALISKQIKSNLLFQTDFKNIINKTILSKLSIQTLSIINHAMKDNPIQLNKYLQKLKYLLDQPQYQKKQLKFTKHKQRYESGYVGLQNPHSICYINSLLQQLYHIPQFRKCLYLTPWKQNPLEQQDLILQLKKIFINLNYRQTDSYINPQFFNAFKNDQDQPTRTDIQMDVQQFLNILFQRIQKLIIKPKNQKQNFIQKIFAGKQLTLINCHQCKKPSILQQQFSSIFLQVKGIKNLQNALNKYFQKQILNQDNMYYCNTCQKKVIASKNYQIKQFPTHLRLVLKRFQYIYLYRKKINQKFQFPLDSLTIDGVNFKLKGIIVHQGISQSGHYFSIIKLNNKWYQFNDTHILQLTDQQVKNFCYGDQQPQCNRNAYILFYKKIIQTNIQQTQPFQDTFTQQQQQQILSQLQNQKPIKIQLQQIKKSNNRLWKSDLIRSKQFQQFIKISVQNHLQSSMQFYFKYLLTIKCKIHKLDLIQFKSMFLFLDHHHHDTFFNNIFNNKDNLLLLQQFYRQKNLPSSLKYLLTQILVQKHDHTNQLLIQFLKFCIKQINQQVQTAPYYQLFLSFIQKDQQLKKFLINQHIVYIILNRCFNYRAQLANNYCQSNFAIQCNRPQLKKQPQDKQLRCHKWKLINYIIEHNYHLLSKQQHKYMEQFHQTKIIKLYQDAHTKASINQISRLLCQLSSKNYNFGKEYFSFLVKQIRFRQNYLNNDQNRKYFKALYDILGLKGLTNSQQSQRMQTIKHAFAQAFSSQNLSYFQLRWQWLIKISLKYEQFRNMIRKSQKQFQILLSQQQIPQLYDIRYVNTNNLQAKDKNKYYGIFISYHYENSLFNTKILKTRMILKPTNDIQLKQHIKTQPNYDTDLTDYPTSIFPFQQIYKYDQNEHKFSKITIKDIIGDIIIINDQLFDIKNYYFFHQIIFYLDNQLLFIPLSINMHFLSCFIFNSLYLSNYLQNFQLLLVIYIFMLLIIFNNNLQKQFNLYITIFQTIIFTIEITQNKQFLIKQKEIYIYNHFYFLFFLFFFLIGIELLFN